MAGVNESFGESVALFVSISVGGGGLSFRSPVVWQLAAADLLFLFLLRGDVGSTLVDGLSALMIRLWPCGGRQWLLRHIQGRWTCSEAGCRRQHVGVLISACFLEDCMYFAVFCLFSGAFRKVLGVFVMPLFNPFNIYSPSKKKDELGRRLVASLFMQARTAER
jgi:hypothetical protein